MTDSIAAQVAALPKTPTPELKQMWRELFDEAARFQPQLPDQPPRLPDPGAGVRRAQARDPGQARRGRQSRPEGLKAHREWAGRGNAVDPRVARRRAQGHGARRRLRVGGRRYKSLSAVARAITGTRWNGLTFFGVKRHGGGA